MAARDGIQHGKGSRLASWKRISLLDALSDLVNLKGSTPLTRDIQPEDVKRFRVKHPDFFPADCYDVAQGRPVWPGVTEGLGLRYFRMYQNWLRMLWRGRPADARSLDILLGLEPDQL